MLANDLLSTPHKQMTIEQVMAAIAAFQKDGKCQVSDKNTNRWTETTDPTWNFEAHDYRPIPAAVYPKVIHKIGNWYKDAHHNLFLLAQEDYGKVCLIAVAAGNRKCAAVKVDNVNQLSNEEWAAIGGLGLTPIKSPVKFSR